MRNQQTPIIRENAFYPEIEPLCNDSRPSEKSESEKVAMCITATGRQQPASGVGNNAGNLQSQLDFHRDKSLLAQPVFVLEKKDRPFKRHAGDLTANAEDTLSVHPSKRLRSSSFTFSPTQSSTETDRSFLDKRVRSSSFTLLTSFPPHQPVLKNNVFMPSTLLQEHRRGADAESVPSWTVIKPATLSPPAITVCRDARKAEVAAVSTGQENKMQEDKTDTPVSNAEQPKSPGSACSLGFKTGTQPFQQMSMMQKHYVDFVFGENMEKRVKSPKRPTATQTGASKRELSSTRISCNRNWLYQRRKSHTSLAESAAAYTSRPKIKYELNQVNIVTGEESERNVLQVNCRLFVLNKDDQSWTERGHGYLRLNDTATNCNGPLRSRIVIRNHGNLRLILNSRIFKEMKLERANRRSVHITASDLRDNGVKIFLVQGGAKDVVRLYAAIHHRLVALRSQRDQEQERSCPKSEAEAESHIRLLNSDSEDEEDDEKLLDPNKISDHHQWIRQQPALYS